MDKKRFSNPWFIAALLLLISLPIKFFFAYFNNYTLAPQILAAFIIGSQYARSLKRNMPETLQIDIAGIFAIGSILFNILLLTLFKIPPQMLAALIIQSIFEAIVIYWGLETWAVRRKKTWLEIMTPRIELSNTSLANFPKKYPLMMLGWFIVILSIIGVITSKDYFTVFNILNISGYILISIGMLYPNKRYLNGTNCGDYDY